MRIWVVWVGWFIDCFIDWLIIYRLIVCWLAVYWQNPAEGERSGPCKKTLIDFSLIYWLLGRSLMEAGGVDPSREHQWLLIDWLIGRSQLELGGVDPYNRFERWLNEWLVGWSCWTYTVHKLSRDENLMIWFVSVGWFIDCFIDFLIIYRLIVWLMDKSQLMLQEEWTREQNPDWWFVNIVDLLADWLIDWLVGRNLVGGVDPDTRDETLIDGSLIDWLPGRSLVEVVGVDPTREPWLIVHWLIDCSAGAWRGWEGWNL